MFGKQKTPFSVGSEKISITTESERGGVIYRRALADKTVEKLLLASKPTLLICPV